MNSLENKYVNDTLNLEELAAFRRSINDMTDEELGNSLEKEWMEEDFDFSKDDAVSVKTLKKRIIKSIFRRRHLQIIINKVLKVAAIAAIIISPILAFVSYHLYSTNESMSEQTIVCRTGNNEHANITLPDGTVVALNENTSLSYTSGTYNDKERDVLFDGEASFSVVKDKTRPFMVKADGMDVTVLGTQFYLRARKSENLGDLYLERGSVRLLATNSNSSKILIPGDRAFVSKIDGVITIQHDNDIEKDVLAWKRNEIVLHYCTFGEIVSCLEQAYGVKIMTDVNSSSSDAFTGTLPSNNLSEALHIIKTIYHVKISYINKNTISITRRSY
jgi:transmembrane sensor